MIEVLNPVIRGCGNYYRKANVRTLFHRLERWIERRLLSFIAQRWRNTAWRRYPTSRLVNEFGLVRLIHLVPGIKIIPRGETNRALLADLPRTAGGTEFNR